MEVYKQILTKNEINVRFIMAINAILDKKMVNSKVDLAESLNVKPSKFSEILNGRICSVKHIRCLRYGLMMSQAI